MLTSVLLLLLYSAIVVGGLTAYKHGSNLYRAGGRRRAAAFVAAAVASQAVSFPLMIVLVGRLAVPTIIAGAAGLNVMLLTLVASRTLGESLGARALLANAAIVSGILLMSLDP